MTGYESKRAAARDKMAQPEQEPVGVVCVDTTHAHIVYGSQYLGRQPDKKTAMFFKDCEVGEQLYTLPPQRPWVGLMRGVRVEGDTVVIKVQSNNEARLLCSELVNEMGKNT